MNDFDTQKISYFYLTKKMVHIKKLVALIPCAMCKRMYLLKVNCPDNQRT